MPSETKKLSLASFGLALFCFLFPFISVSCNQQKVASFTGFQLVFGTTVQQPEMFGPPKRQKVDEEPLADLAFLCCAAACGLCLAKSRNAEIGSAVLAAISFICLIQLKSKLQDQVLRSAGGMLQVDYEFGFWIVALLIVVGGGLAVVAPWRSKSIPSASNAKDQTPP